MKQISEYKRAKMTGKGSHSQFLRLPYHVLGSPEWAALNGNEIKMLIELFRQFNGSNNGDFSATYGSLKGRGWKSKDTITRTLKSLEASGWIVTTRQGGRHIGCSLYGVTWEPINWCKGKHQWPTEITPSNAWRKNGAPITGEQWPDDRAITPRKLGS